jgi:NAD(P)-dependent dehydrogenase (short-subunit alcohol dehydrogenase family)
MTATPYKNLFHISGRRALITGATGILGRHYAAGFAEMGADLCLVDLDEGACTALAGELMSKYGVKTVGLGVNIADQAQVIAMAAQAQERLGPIDVLLNNAASKGNSMEAFFASVEDYSEETWREVMQVNLDGLFFVAQQVGKRMAERGRGSIIQISSIYGVVGPDQRIYEGSDYMGLSINTPPVYSASKAGVIGLTKYLATYWAGKGVRVNTLTPGGVESGQNDRFQRQYSQRVPLGRMAHEREMVGAAIFLASDASQYITGHNLIVDGGLSIW